MSGSTHRGSDLVELVEDQTGLRIDSLTEDTLTDTAQESLEDADLSAPSYKRLKMDVDIMHNYFANTSVYSLIQHLGLSLHKRLDDIDEKMKSVCKHVIDLESKLTNITSTVNEINVRSKSADTSDMGDLSAKDDVVVVGLPNVRKDNYLREELMNGHSHGQNVTIITLNHEGDYPDGCWLGDETNPELRVRVPITPSTLLHINTNCRTAEKMSLTLLDHLFDRHTQAESNLSGSGRYNKKQLDPLFVYGIRCHCIHHFESTDSDWHRIKQNIDSKCRTAFRRKQRGLRMAVKSFRSRHAIHGGVLCPENTEITAEATASTTQERTDDLAATSDGTSSFTKNEIQILHATAEQIAQLQHAQHIEILRGKQIIDQLSSGNSKVQMAISVISPEQLQLQTVEASNDGIHLDTPILPISPVNLGNHLVQDVGEVEQTFGNLN